MKKFLKLSVLILLLVCTISLCGCLGFVYSKTYWSGIFGYTKPTSSECCIAAINGQNNKLEAIEIPDYIDGYKVTSVFAGSAKVRYIEHDYVKTLYIGTTVKSMSDYGGYGLFYCKNLERIVINRIDLPSMMFGLESTSENCVVVISQESLEKELEVRPKDESVYGWIRTYNIVLANVEYHYNYENSPNGDYYRIDYVKNADEIPYRFAEPTREGYTFSGWYLEPACQTQWDNSIHKIFEEPITTQIYQDTSYKEVEMVTNKLQLYAKWIKN